MVSYYNYPQKHSAANLAYSAGQPWNWTPNYPAGNHQFLSDMETSPHPHPQMYYSPHMFHSPANVSSDWHSPTSTVGAENFAQNVPTSAHHLIHSHHAHNLGVGLTGSLSGGAGGIGGGGGGVSGGVGGGGGGGSHSSASNSSASNGPAGNTQLNETNSSLNEPQQQQQHITEGLPSPPITVSGSEISSPGAPASSTSPHNITHHINTSGNSAGGNSSANNNNNNHTSPTGNNNNNPSVHNSSNNRSSPSKHHQYYDWMKKPAYPAQPQPDGQSNDYSIDIDEESNGRAFLDLDQCSKSSFDDFNEILKPLKKGTNIETGKTRTKDKYRVVYTDYQRLELEKEYCTSRYITIRRKSELAQSLALSERQVKIWFQNRRAKERKQNKKGSEPNVMSSVPQHDYMMDAKAKLEPGLHLHNPLHPMNPMAAMPMRLQHFTHSHSLAAAAAAHSHQLQHSMSAAAAAASVGALSM